MSWPETVSENTVADVAAPSLLEEVSETVSENINDVNQMKDISVMLFRPTVKSKGRPPKSSIKNLINIFLRDNSPNL